MILFFDTETTGLIPGGIIQLSYIMERKNGTAAKNFFFAVDYIEPSATEVHGFTVEKIYELSGGRTFSEFMEEIYDDFSSADLIVAHNARFDIGFMIAEYCRCERRFRYKEEFDTMRYFTPILKLERANHKGWKFPKLGELCEYFEIYPYDITRKTVELFGDAAGRHDARYDTVAMYLSFVEGTKKIAELQEIASKHLQNDK